MFKVGDMVKMNEKAFLYGGNENAIGYIVRIAENKTLAFPISVTFITQLTNKADYPEHTWAFKSPELKKMS